jgi:peptidyl-dipeptidase A
MKYLLPIILVLSVSCLNEKQQSEMILRHYLDKNVDLIRNFTMESTVALWNVNLSGNESDYKKLLDLEMDFNNSNKNSTKHFAPDKFTPFTQNVFSNEQDFQLLRKLKNSGLITDTILKRQLTFLYQSFMGPQVEADRYKKLIFAETKLWQSFSVVYVVIGKKAYSASQLDSLRKNSGDIAILRSIHEAYREKGKQIAGDIIQMVKTRNEFARSFGYTDYYQLALETKDQTPDKIKTLMDDIALKTHDQYFEAKSMIDKVLAKRYRISIPELRAYHFNDERTSYLPRKFSDKMDSLFRDKDPIQLAAGFFEGIGLPIQDVIERSELKSRKGKKSSGTNIFNIDFRNDLRMMATIDPNMEGMKKMMHLGGHASHFKNISDSIPYLLKDPNAVVAEGVSSFFENLASNNGWLKSEFDMDSVSNKEFELLCMHFIQVDRLFRFRRLLVKSIFEREIYRDPDQNLGALWYRLNEKYLGIRPPDDQNTTDWATNSYFTSFSCSVHNYVLADLFAGQLQHYIEKNLLNNKYRAYHENKAVGNFLVSKVYKNGDIFPWEQLIEQATGEPLNPSYFANYLTGANEQEQIRHH